MDFCRIIATFQKLMRDKEMSQKVGPGIMKIISRGKIWGLVEIWEGLVGKIGMLVGKCRLS